MGALKKLTCLSIQNSPEGAVWVIHAIHAKIVQIKIFMSGVTNMLKILSGCTH